MKYVNKPYVKSGKFYLGSRKPYVKRGKFYLGSGKKQRSGFLPSVGLVAKLLPIASTGVSILGKGKKKRGRKRRRLRY